MSIRAHGAWQSEAAGGDSWPGLAWLSSCVVRPQPPAPPSPDALPTNVKQAYRTFAAVPGPHPLQDTPTQVRSRQPALRPRGPLGPGPEAPCLRTHFPQPPTPGATASPEQLSFRERQKYFELEVRVPQAEGPPKRVSLVGADDLRKMQEEEGRWQVGGQEGPGGRPS